MFNDPEKIRRELMRNWRFRWHYYRTRVYLMLKTWIKRSKSSQSVKDGICPICKQETVLTTEGICLWCYDEKYHPKSITG